MSSALTHQTQAQPSPSPPKLHIDIFIHLKEILIQDQQKATAANLMACSKTLYDIFLPVLEYRTLERYKCIRWSYERQPSTPAPLPSLGRFDILAVSHHDHAQSQTILPSTCMHLTVQDVPSALDLVMAQEAIGRSTLLFPNLEKFVLGPNLSAAILADIDHTASQTNHMSCSPG
ncbi:hypothetical protein IAT40_003901 [Kwoniella sp. CBS 6097]